MDSQLPLGIFCWSVIDTRGKGVGWWQTPGAMIIHVFLFPHTHKSIYTSTSRVQHFPLDCCIFIWIRNGKLHQENQISIYACIKVTFGQSNIYPYWCSCDIITSQNHTIIFGWRKQVSCLWVSYPGVYYVSFPPPCDLAYCILSSMETNDNIVPNLDPETIHSSGKVYMSYFEIATLRSFAKSLSLICHLNAFMDT